MSSLQVQSGRHALNVSLESTSLQLSSLPPHEDAKSVLSAGSTHSDDSFIVDVTVPEHPDDDDDSSYDPYLGSSSHRRRRRSNNNKAHSQHPHYCTTITTTKHQHSQSLDDRSTSATPETTSSHTSPSLLRETTAGVRLLVPSTLEIPSKLNDNKPAVISQRAVSTASSSCATTASAAVQGHVHERVFWNAVVSHRVAHCGAVHLRTAHGLLQLGEAHLKCNEHKEALKVFLSAVRIFRRLCGDQDLQVALALDKVGRATLQAAGSHNANDQQATKQCAKDAIHQALLLRHQVLGPTHVDTVETLNHLALVHALMGEYKEALQAYAEVKVIRETIFGKMHPSVAVAAHAMGGMHVKLAQLEEAQDCFHYALDIYRHVGVSQRNPTVVKLLKDLESMERIMSTMGFF